MAKCIPGVLRRRMTIKKNVATADGDGTYTNAESIVATRQVTIRPLTGTEVFEAKQTGAEASHEIRIRHDSVTAAIKGSTHWLEDDIDGRVFEIAGKPINDYERDIWMRFRCKVRE